jgi:hypothetical protein
MLSCPPLRIFWTRNLTDEAAQKKVSIMALPSLSHGYPEERLCFEGTNDERGVVVFLAGADKFILDIDADGPPSDLACVSRLRVTLTFFASHTQKRKAPALAYRGPSWGSACARECTRCNVADSG